MQETTTTKHAETVPAQTTHHILNSTAADHFL